jgi:hypothetical protein
MGEVDASVHQTLGQLLAEVTNLRTDIRSVKDEMRRSEDKSDVSRAAVHKRMDEIVSRVGSLEASAAATQEDISEMKPVTEDVRKWKLMGIGALGVVGIGGTAIGVMLAGVLENVAHFLKGP